MKTGVKILIIDDSSTNNLLCKSILEESGYQVIISDKSSQALKLIRKEKPALLLLDIMMPDVDGFEILSSLKADLLLKDILVIMLSAKTDQLSMKEAFEKGAIDYLLKPIAPGKLLKTVKKFLD